MSMKIRDILRIKGHEVITVGPEQPVLAAIRILAEHRIGALVVRDQGEIVGIISERDVLNLAAGDPARLEDTLVSDIMTSNVIVGVPEDDLDYVMNIMTQNRIRHLPIMEGERLVGLVSIGDVVNAVRRAVEAENRHLKDYIQGVAR
jgi:CBS domain-containing protein